LLEDLPRLFDPWATPDDRPSERWLDCLSGWVDVERDEGWPSDKRRRTVATAFRDHARRGTIGSLRRLVELYTNAQTRIEEVPVGAWGLGVGSALGFDTALAPPGAQEAVLGATAVVNRARVRSADETATLVLDGDAHRFCVQVYAADAPTPDSVARVRRVVDREKPAYTVYHLCVIQPRMRVGFQARLGIDAIVAGPHEPGMWDDPRELGVDTVLASSGARSAPIDRIGSSARVGSGATLA